MMNFGAVTVTDTLTLIMSPKNERRSYIIANNGNKTVYIGFSSSVTAATGIPLFPTGRVDIGGTEDVWAGYVYGICVTAESSDIRFMEWGTK